MICCNKSGAVQAIPVRNQYAIVLAPFEPRCPERLDRAIIFCFSTGSNLLEPKSVNTDNKASHGTQKRKNERSR